MKTSEKLEELAVKLRDEQLAGRAAGVEMCLDDVRNLEVQNRELIAALEWASRSHHHPTCTHMKGKCTCHVGAAREALRKARGNA